MNTAPSCKQGLLIIGIGSPFGDDRAGWEVIEKLQRMELPSGIRLLSLDRPGVELIEQMQGHARVILIDAVHSEEHPPGTCLELTQRSLRLHDNASTHGFGLAETLRLGQSLNALPLQLQLYGICIRPPQASPDTTISPAIRAAAVQFARQLAFCRFNPRVHTPWSHPAAGR